MEEQSLIYWQQQQEY